MARMRALSGEQALRCPKWAVAKRLTELLMQKLLMALLHRPSQGTWMGHTP
jgi:hypothetical protein